MADPLKRFRVAFSFAGEKRDFVASLASILADKFGEAAILYDKYHEAEFAQWKLGLTLPHLYREQSDLIVLVICSDYSKKNWCGLEWLAIHGFLMSGNSRQVMLCRFGHAELEGIYENAGFIELDHKTTDEVVKRILERLALNEGGVRDHYTTSSDSPAMGRELKAGPGLLCPPGSSGAKSHAPKGVPSPFHPVGAIGDDVKSYVTRASDGELKRAIKHHTFIWVQGDFQFGKTSLLRRFGRWLDDEWIVVRPDLELCDHSANERFWRDFFAEIEETISNNDMISSFGRGSIGAPLSPSFSIIVSPFC